ncbi:MAG TPA: M20/M25/M40 family metallo-hydrolase [Bryobacteraceae bacterium]|nr:M20/M25/M40 family metallo-hydrolase [Bryobacteraceae bacterium]
MIRVFAVASLVVWVVLGFWPPRRPDPLPASAPADRFSAERAMVIVRAIAQRPHPPGTDEHRRVQDWIRAALAREGLDSSIQTGSAGGDPAENILARMPGTANTRAVMLAAHYDSRPEGPGASDDGSGVATLLETLRALRAGPRLRNDVIFLITDAEERGLIGARVFMNDHPWRHDPGVVLNFEARGTSGPSYMFETSPGNLTLIRQLQHAVPWAQASSLSYEVYRRMPNDTDLTVFKRGGLNGLNFAFIDHVEFYHTRFDDAAHLDLRSLQEDGRYALNLTRAFGNVDLSNVRSSYDAVYFTTLLTPLMVYPGTWAVPIAVVLLLAASASRRIPLIIVGVLGVLCAWQVPGASYTLAWPLAGGLVGQALFLRRSLSAPVRGALIALTPAPVALILLPLIPTFTTALGLRHAWPVIVIDLAISALCLDAAIRYCVNPRRGARSADVSARGHSSGLLS